MLCEAALDVFANNLVLISSYVHRKLISEVENNQFLFGIVHKTLIMLISTVLAKSL